MVPSLFSDGFPHHSKTWVMAVLLSMKHVSISVANNFVHSFTAADQEYQAFGELAQFVYCLLQKIKKLHHRHLYNNGKNTLSGVIPGVLRLMRKTFSTALA